MNRLSISNSRGFSLVDISIALIVLAVVAAAAVKVQIREAKRVSAAAQADQLIEIRNALIAYVDTYRGSLLANDNINFTVGSGGPITNTRTQLPSVAQLIGVGLLPTTFSATAGLNAGGYSMSAPVFVPSTCLSTDPKTCRISGHVRLTQPLLQSPSVAAVNAGQYDADLAFDTLDALGGNGFVSMSRGGSYLAANGAFTLTNDASFLGVSQPAGIVGIRFTGSAGSGTLVPYSDYCPGDSITIGSGKVGNSNPWAYAGTVTFNSTTYSNSTSGMTIVGSSNSAGKSCSSATAYRYPDVQVNLSGIAAGYSTTGANNTGVLRVDCKLNSSGVAVPSFTIYSC